MANNAMFLSNTREFEIQRANNFQVILEGFPWNVFPLAVENFSLPDLSNDIIELAYGNQKVKVAGVPTLGELSVTVKDFIEIDVENILLEWRQKVYNSKTGDIGWAADYKKNGSFYEYSPDWTVRRSWVLIGVWPSSITLGEFSYEDGSKRQITMQLQVDQAYRG